MKELTEIEVTEIEKVLRARGIEYKTTFHEEVNWDDEKKAYIPSTYTYTVVLFVSGAKTGNRASIPVESIEGIDAAIATAAAQVKAASRKTRQAIAAENRVS